MILNFDAVKEFLEPRWFLTINLSCGYRLAIEID